MQLNQYLTIKDEYNNNVISIQSNDNNFDIIASKVKIKNKRSQSAINSKERLEQKYCNSIDKGNAKKSFYNKHKNK